MEASLQVPHTDPLSPPELCLVLPCIIESVLVLGHTFIDWENVLADLVRLPGLDAWD